ncbi:pseudaminic acid cytidylyltransferase [Leptospira bandrabouensis]|uniref:pseudaminic acid cytidylyltransferase n=1 Tax=Leptospira bandrabouensis TaxID=2484903 RepID=UPI00223D9C3F|nr:pseudaminic acid cytidylyltransferase [Leptospira bandrabouensis]MCW7459354.1 pseudaminic acid cytidylyltransferase [Leptospira bandrabouensis]MCW7478213.1 pseudaminic acid cytidylyltransferase [Leptospira bandrabouensis]MCW7485665.1 pseudaminic acid cytidylyltransferase [Leptospira bandrabouensis]
MTNICIIPARGGSKRIPRKNIKLFHGKPMIAYSIETAIQSKLFDRVIVSTDDLEIAEVSRHYGAEVPFMRPSELSDDNTATIPVIAHGIQWMIREGITTDCVACIYATAPFILKNDLISAEKSFREGGWEYVFSATSFGFPIFRGFKKDTDGKIEMFFPEHFGTRSQDLPEAFHDAGQFYFGKPNAWLEGKRIFDKWSSIVELPRWRVQDIDTGDDWDRAEVLYKMISTMN